MYNFENDNLINNMTVKSYLHSRINLNSTLKEVSPESFYSIRRHKGSIQYIKAILVYLRTKEDDFAPYTIQEVWEPYIDDDGTVYPFVLLDKDGFDVCGEYITLEDAIQSTRGLLYKIEYLPTYD